MLQRVKAEQAANAEYVAAKEVSEAATANSEYVSEEVVRDKAMKSAGVEGVGVEKRENGVKKAKIGPS